MKAKIIGRMIVLGTVLISAAACNPLISSFSSNWYSSNTSQADWG